MRGKGRVVEGPESNGGGWCGMEYEDSARCAW